MIGKLQPIGVLYKNHRGVTRFRKVTPYRMWYGVSPYHIGEQWFITAFAEDKPGGQRDFALKDCDFTIREEDANNTK